jgi:hypothetical protein
MEGIYCEFKSCYHFVMFFFFLSYADQRDKSQFIADFWLQYVLFAEPSSMKSECPTVVSVFLVIMVFSGPSSVVFMVSVCWPG